jgi:phospholipid-binding lipoprotein MlaA
VKVWWLRLCLVLMLFAVQGCASVPNPDSRDPMESWNRGVFGFNEALDGVVVKPVATAYRVVTPQWVRTGVGNFFNNLSDIWSAVNNALQLRGQDTVDSVGRVLINSTVGLLGVIDVATELEVERHPANFGLTLGRWGMPSGAYVVLPLLGPSSVRDFAGFPIDTMGSVVSNIPDVATRNSLMVLNIVDTRAAYLEAGNVVDGAALDKYSFMRDAYLQRRRNQVYDGNPPEEDAETAQ